MSCNIYIIRIFLEISWLLLVSCFIFRLREVAEKISHHGFVNAPGFRAIRNLVITQCVVGPTYIALLLEVYNYFVT